MPTIKCTKCSQESRVGFMSSVSKTKGMAGIEFYKPKLSWVFPIWPFQTSLVAICPSCKEKTKLIVITTKKTKIITISILIVILLFLALLIYAGSLNK